MTDTGRIPKPRLEWFKESASSVVQRPPMADFNRDTFIDFFDDGGFDTAYTASSTTADINDDGVVNATSRPKPPPMVRKDKHAARAAWKSRSGP